MATKNTTHGPVAEAQAAEHLNEIYRLLPTLQAQAERLAKEATWPAVGSLARIHEALAELVGERG